MVIPPAPSPLPPPHQPPNPYLNGQLGNIYGYSGVQSCEDEEDLKKRRYNRAVDELRGETRMLLFVGLLAVALVGGAIFTLIHFNILWSVLKWVGLAGAALGGFYGTAELIFRWRRRKFDEEYATSLMKDEV